MIPTSFLWLSPYFYPSFINKFKSCLCLLLPLLLFLKPILIRLLLSLFNKVILVKLTNGLCVTKSNVISQSFSYSAIIAGFDPVALLKTLSFSTETLGPHHLSILLCMANPQPFAGPSLCQGLGLAANKRVHKYGGFKKACFSLSFNMSHRQTV